MQRLTFSTTVFPPGPTSRPTKGQMTFALLPEHPAPAVAVAWSSNSGVLAAVAGAQVCLYALPSAQRLFTYVGHERAIRAMAFAPTNGLQVASLSEDHSLHIWSCVPPDLYRSTHYPLHHSEKSIAWFPDGGALVVAGDQQLRLYTPEYREDVQTFAPFHALAITHVAWSPLGDRIVTIGNDGRFAVWDVFTGAMQCWCWMPTSPTRLSWSPDGSHLALAFVNGDVKVWSMGRPSLLQETSCYEGHADRVSALAWSPDSRVLVSGDVTGTLTFWTAASARPLLSLSLHTPILDLAWSSGEDLAIGTQAYPLLLLQIPLLY